VFVTGRMPQSGKLPVFNLLTGRKSAFSPHKGDSGGNAAPKMAKISTFW